MQSKTYSPLLACLVFWVLVSAYGPTHLTLSPSVPYQRTVFSVQTEGTCYNATVAIPAPAMALQGVSRNTQSETYQKMTLLALNAIQRKTPQSITR